VVAPVSTLESASPASRLGYHWIGSQRIISVARLRSIILSSQGPGLHLRKNIGWVGVSSRRKWWYRRRRREAVRIVEWRVVIVERWLGETSRIALHETVRVAVEAAEWRTRWL